MSSVSITVGAVVLDRPDQSGEFIARDLVGGWAYIVADSDGDRRFRGQGSCAGGLASGLRYAFVAAVGCVPQCRRITIYVDTAHAHQQLVRLATSDAQVVAAIASRPVFVMTRPEERSLPQVRQAAERAASLALRARAHLERQETPEPSLEPVRTEPEQVATAPTTTAEPRQSWRSRWSRRSALDPVTIRAAERLTPRPVTIAEPEPSRARARMQWLHEFDSRAESVQTGLQSVGW